MCIGKHIITPSVIKMFTVDIWYTYLMTMLYILRMLPAAIVSLLISILEHIILYSIGMIIEQCRKFKSGNLKVHKITQN